MKAQQQQPLRSVAAPWLLWDAKLVRSGLTVEELHVPIDNEPNVDFTSGHVLCSAGYQPTDQMCPVSSRL